MMALKGERWIVLVTVAAMFCVALASCLVHERIVRELRDERKRTFGSTLQGTKKALRFWFAQEERTVLAWARSRPVIEATRALLATKRTPEALRNAPAQRRLNVWLSRVHTTLTHRGFFIISNDDINLGSTRPHNIGIKTLLLARPAFLRKVRSKQTHVSMPQVSPIPLRDAQGRLRAGMPTMFSGAPVLDKDGKVLAILTLRINPLNSFSRLLERGRHGQSGETYAFDRRGRMLSQSRFLRELKDKALLKPQDSFSLLRVVLREPDVRLPGHPHLQRPISQQPMTRPVRLASQGKDGMDLIGYPNYLGRVVLGAWSWDARYGFGIVTEIHEEEANRSIRMESLLMFLLMAFLEILLLTFATLLGALRRRTFLRNEELERRVVQRTQELEDAKLRAETAATVKGRFLANMSHELRTPMNAVIGLSDLMLSESLTPRQRERLERLQSAGRLLLNVVDDILDFSKIEAGMLVLDPKPFELEQLLQNIEQIVSFAAEQKRLTLRFCTASGLPVLEGDSLRLEQVLLNLTSNAIKFTETGEVEVNSEVISRDDDKATIRFRVRDTGIGIDQKERDKLFRPFSQVDASSTRKYGGTGLGLAISQQLVQAMGASLTCESEVGVGSTFQFSVVLPVYKGEFFSNSSVSFEDLRGMRVLIIEDNPMNQLITRELLEQAGLVAEAVDNGKLALERLATPHDFAVILMDLQMPELDGVQTTREIRQTLGLSLPIIALTAHASAAERKFCFEAGIDDYLSKPIDLEGMLKTLAKWTLPAQAATRTSEDQSSDHPLHPDQSSEASVDLDESGETVSEDDQKGNSTPDDGTEQKTMPFLPGIHLEDVSHRIGVPPEDLLEIFELFEEQAQKLHREMRDALKNEDLQTVRRHAHTFKGMASNLSAYSLTSAASELEIAQSPQAIHFGWRAFETALSQALRSVGLFRKFKTAQDDSLFEEE